jgi:hypothetical protein
MFDYLGIDKGIQDMFDYLGIDKGIQDQKLLPIGGRRNEYIESNSSPELTEQRLCHVIGWKGLM